MTKKGSIPIRTCIGCRQKRKKEEMIWLKQSPAGRAVRVNTKKPHRGRGFYLCPDLQCLNIAKGRKKSIDLLGAMDFEYLVMNDSSKSDKISVEEEWNDKE